jgi:hypothetical protein
MQLGSATEMTPCIELSVIDGEGIMHCIDP